MFGIPVWAVALVVVLLLILEVIREKSNFYSRGVVPWWVWPVGWMMNQYFDAAERRLLQSPVLLVLDTENWVSGFEAAKRLEIIGRTMWGARGRIHTKLQRLKDAQLVTSREFASDYPNGLPRTCYQLTSRGLAAQEALEREHSLQSQP